MLLLLGLQWRYVMLAYHLLLLIKYFVAVFHCFLQNTLADLEF